MTYLISKHLDMLATRLGVAHKIHSHAQRWGWVDGIESIDVQAARIRRVRHDLRIVVSSLSIVPECTLRDRLSLIRQLPADQKRLYKAWGVRLRPAIRTTPLP